MFLNIFIPQKLSKVAAPDPFSSSSSQVASGSRRVGENKLLTKAGGSKSRFTVCLYFTYSYRV